MRAAARSLCYTLAFLFVCVLSAAAEPLAFLSGIIEPLATDLCDDADVRLSRLLPPVRDHVQLPESF